tara:strand:+ start:149 stop:397 length:249 start_codon:yes stop_codon:yes gene_type:complete
MSNLSLKKKDDIFIKLTECLDKSSSSNYLDNVPIKARSINYGWVMALKWVLGYDELHKQSEDNDELPKPLPDSFKEIDMNTL